jgi:hypothetical protein
VAENVSGAEEPAVEDSGCDLMPGFFREPASIRWG